MDTGIHALVKDSDDFERGILVCAKKQYVRSNGIFAVAGLELGCGSRVRLAGGQFSRR